MAIHINFLHEQKTQQQQAERDPLKLGMLVILVIGMLMGVFYFWKQSGVSAVQATASGAEAAYAKMEPMITQYEKEKSSLEAKVAMRTELGKRVEERFFWAPALETLARSVPLTAQINSLRGNASSPQIIVELNGLIAGPEPRVMADKLRQTLIDTMKSTYDNVAGDFKDLEEHEGNIRYKDVDYPAADFSIVLKLTRKQAQQAETEAPAK